MSLLGTMIGRIRLVDRLGRGGMGEVFAGYDETLGRRVAVKCVHAGHRLDEKVKGRFLQEARILSRLAHPNICQIYDFVEGDDRDFLVMELVTGESLKQAMAQGMDARAKLRVAEQVAGVLVAAHAEGVVHRDLKPEHVMITPEGEVKVLDFGVAHSLPLEGEETAELSAIATALFDQPIGDPHRPPYQTVAGSLVGTPRYMSPEQARGEPVTPASDMYTFGLLLQELFTGEPPYARKPLEELLKDVAEGRSQPASGLGRPLTELVEGLKKLSPDQRPTAKETADRLRWIRETPRRWLRRGLAALVIALVVAAVVKYTLDLQRERTLAIEARNQAVVARDQAEDLVTFMLEDLSQELRPVGKLGVLEKVAQKALEYYEQALPGTVGEASFRRGRAFYRVADVLQNQGDLEAALEATRAAKDLHQQLVDDHPERSEWQNGLALDHLQLGSILQYQGDRAAAREAYATGRALAARLVALEPEQLEWRKSLAEAHYGLGLYDLFHDSETAVAEFREAIGIYRELAEREPEEPFYTFRLAVLYGQGLGQAYDVLGRGEEALDAIREAYSLYEQLTVIDPSNSRWQHGFAWENRRMGGHVEEQGLLEQALGHYRRAEEISRRLLSLEPSQVDWQLGLSFDYSAIGGILEQQGDLSGALDSYRRALEISRPLVEQDPTNEYHQLWLAMDRLRVGSLLSRLGQQRAAEESWRKAAQALEPLAADSRDPDGEVLSFLAVAWLSLGRVEDARPLVQRLREMQWFDGQVSDELVELSRRYGLL